MIPIKRDSLEKGIEKRYDSQKSGGAFDAKSAGNATVDYMSDEFADGFTKGGKNTNLPKKDSLMLRGFVKHRYTAF